MIPVLLIAAAGLAAFLNRDSGAFGPAVANLVIAFWANGS
jgi:hypothetical protein